MGRSSLLLSSILAMAFAGCTGGLTPHAPLPHVSTYSEYGAQVVDALVQDLFVAGGYWQACDGGCDQGNSDWGDDSLTYVLYLRWLTTHDASLAPMFRALTSTAIEYGSCRGPSCAGWSDVPEWDAIADEREYEVTADPRALDLARKAYATVRDSDAYASGACPSIRYQHPFAAGGGLKTLETDSNAIKAALLLFQATHEQSYLDEARSTYQAVRDHFFDAERGLYTVYLFDDGQRCFPLPARFFASVNGNMIWSGVTLSTLTGEGHYHDNAALTARAVDLLLTDERGVYENPQAENDVAEPLVEGFFSLARESPDNFARDFLLRNAESALRNARIPDGLYGRFWGGPAPRAPVTAWQANGGLALAVVAAALDPAHVVAAGDDWANATEIAVDLTAVPSSLPFSGAAVAILGTLGEQCCEAGHASLEVDSWPLTDQTGIWQNKSSAGRPFDDTILFSWQFRAAGPHSLSFGPSTDNAKEGGPFLHIRKVLLRPGLP